jgi:hypothetical protein
MPLGTSSRASARWSAVELVGDVDAHAVAFDRLDRRAVHAAVVAPALGAQPGANSWATDLGDEVEDLHAVDDLERQATRRSASRPACSRSLSPTSRRPATPNSPSPSQASSRWMRAACASGIEATTPLGQVETRRDRARFDVCRLEPGQRVRGQLARQLPLRGPAPQPQQHLRASRASASVISPSASARRAWPTRSPRR